MSDKLGTFRDYSEHDVMNLFALSTSSGDKGDLVTIASSTGFNGADPEFVDLTDISNVVIQRPVNPARVRFAASGEGKAEILGMLLYDVRETNFLGVPLIYDPQRKDEAQCVCSGETVPVVRKGLFAVKNWTTGDGAKIGAGSGAVSADAGDGTWKITDGATNSIGKFMGKPNDNGFAVFWLNLE